MRRALLPSVLLVALSGCECGAPADEGGGEVAAPQGETGFVEGVVRLAAGAEIPRYMENPLQVEGRNPIPEDCTPPRDVDRTPVTVADETGGLVGLSIVATGEDESRWPRPPEEPVVHEVVIRDCRLTPSLVVTTRGDRVRISNDTGYPFFPEIGEGILQALLRGEPREVTMDQGGVRTVQCGFAAPCGRMELITLYHPVHTVSGAEGRFRIEVPAEQDVRITAWHPLFDEVATTTRVAPGETREVELTIRPAVLRGPEPTVPTAPDGPDTPSEGGDLPADVAPDPNVPF
jgi:hypothetical protein